MQMNDERVKAAMAKQELIVVRSSELDKCTSGFDMLRKLSIERESSMDLQRRSEPAYARSTAAHRGRSRPTSAQSECVGRSSLRPQSEGLFQGRTRSAATTPSQSRTSSPRKKIT